MEIKGTINFGRVDADGTLIAPEAITPEILAAFMRNPSITLNFEMDKSVGVVKKIDATDKGELVFTADIPDPLLSGSDFGIHGLMHDIRGPNEQEAAAGVRKVITGFELLGISAITPELKKETVEWLKESWGMPSKDCR